MPPAGTRSEVPAAATDVTAYTAITLTVTQTTQTKRGGRNRGDRKQAPRIGS